MSNRLAQQGLFDDEVAFRRPPQWRTIAGLAIVALGLAACGLRPASLGMVEGYILLTAAAVSAALAVACWRIRPEIVIRPAVGLVVSRDRRLTSVREHTVRFEDIRGVRLFLPRRRKDTRLDILTDQTSLPVPLVDLPRRQALALAMAMNVQLIKVTDHEPAVAPQGDRLDALFQG